MPAQTFTFLPGSLALETRPFHFKVVDIIKNVFGQCDGYVGYKLTTLGRASDADVPSFLVVTRQHGIILVDVVEEKIEKTSLVDGAEYWFTDTNSSIPARSMIVEIYEEEIQSRLKNDLSLYDRHTRRAKTPVTSAIIFCNNTKQDTGTWYSEYSDYSSTALDTDALESWLRGLLELTRVFRTFLSGVTIHLEVSDGQGKRQGQSGARAAAVQSRV